MRKQRNLHALVEGATRPGKTLISNKALRPVTDKIKSELHKLTIEIRQTLVKQFNQLKDKLFEGIKESLQMELNESKS